MKNSLKTNSFIAEKLVVNLLDAVMENHVICYDQAIHYMLFNSEFDHTIMYNIYLKYKYGTQLDKLILMNKNINGVKFKHILELEKTIDKCLKTRLSDHSNYYYMYDLVSVLVGKILIIYKPHVLSRSLIDGKLIGFNKFINELMNNNKNIK